MDRIKVNLWYSESQAKKGRIYHIPLSTSDEDEITTCTAITPDQKPPTDSAKFVTAEYLILG
jgi:hypothetical protein